MPRTQLEQAFEEAVCTTPSAPAVRCECGRLHEREDTDPPIYFGTFGGTTLVKGCDCQGAANIGNVIWAERHPVSKFLRKMHDRLEQDRKAMIDVLPVEMGRGE